MRDFSVPGGQPLAPCRQSPICLDQLVVSRQGVPLCQPVTARINAGELWQVRGRNGLGKSTLLLMLAGVLPSAVRHLHWAGQPAHCWQPHYLGHHPGLSAGLSAGENLQFLAALRGRYSRTQRELALQQVGLAGYEDRPLRQLSSGQRRRVALAQLWLPGRLPALWLLDEPLVALDTDMVGRLAQRMTDHLADGGRIVLTSHQALPLPLNTLDLQPDLSADGEPDNWTDPDEPDEPDEPDPADVPETGSTQPAGVTDA